VHSVLDNRNNLAELVGDPLLGSGLDETLHGLERGDLGSPALAVFQCLAQHLEHHSASLDSASLNQRRHSAVDCTSNRLSLVLGQVKQSRDKRQEDTLDTS
jgi:hypothetical protein